ncbi:MULTISPECIES: peptidase M23 [Kitasatospora]|uniref:SH3 domain-containing protein n=1 Tax=Kitasatospora cystarginea TaxID=58350 RepID=A0ABN3E7T8_9ACTN
MSVPKRTLIATGVAAISAAALLMAPTAAQAAEHQTAPTHKTVYVTGTNVHLREYPRTNATILATVSHQYLWDWCQTNRNTTPVQSPKGGTNRWWSKVTLVGGSDIAYVSNVYLQSSGQKIAGVPDC